MNLQDSFLNQVRKDNTEINLVMLDGTRLSGFVRGFDNFTVIINSRGAQHLIYKHAIAQIISRRPQGEGEHGGDPLPGDVAVAQASRGEGRPERRERQGGDRPRQGGAPQGQPRQQGPAEPVAAEAAGTSEPADPAAMPVQAPVQAQPHAHPHPPRAEQQPPRREHRDHRDHRGGGDKFNALDFSQIKVEDK